MRRRQIRAVKVFLQLDAEQARRTDHDVAESAEAEVELESIADDQEPDVDSAQSRRGIRESRVVENRVDARSGIEARRS